MTDSAEVQQVLSKCSPEVLSLVEQVRGVIESVAPDASVRGYPGWHNICYTYRGMNDGVMVGPLRDSVNLYFPKGVGHDDPQGMLEGTGKRMRHVKVREAGDVTGRSEAIKALLIQALQR